MQENEFEKRVRKQMEEFALVPDEEVWKQVKTKIEKEKRRRLLFYWIFAGLLLAGGSGILLLLSKSHNSLLTVVSLDKKPAKNLSFKKPFVEKKDETSVAEKDLIKEDSKSQAEKLNPSFNKETKVASIQKIYFSKEKFQKNKLLAQAKPEMLGFNIENKISQQSKHVDHIKVESGLIETRMEGRKELPPHKYLLSQQGLKLQQDSLQESTVSPEHKTAIRDTLEKSESLIKGKNQSSNSGKFQIGFTLYCGTSDNVTGIGLVSEKSLATADRSSALSSQSSPPAFALPSVSSLQYKSSAAWGAGVYFQKVLTKKVSVTAGIDYHYLSAKSMVGNRIDSTLNAYDSVLQMPATVNPFYRVGQTTSYSNKYHLIQFPVNVRLQLNKNTDHPFLFCIGLSPSFLLASDALYLNSNAAAYYREENQFSHFLLFGQSGLLYTVSNNHKYQLSLGPALQYDFNSFSKPAIHTRQHLIFAGIKTNLTLK